MDYEFSAKMQSWLVTRTTPEIIEYRRLLWYNNQTDKLNALHNFVTQNNIKLD